MNSKFNGGFQKTIIITLILPLIPVFLLSLATPALLLVVAGHAARGYHCARSCHAGPGLDGREILSGMVGRWRRPLRRGAGPRSTPTNGSYPTDLGSPNFLHRKVSGHFVQTLQHEDMLSTSLSGTPGAPSISTRCCRDHDL